MVINMKDITIQDIDMALAVILSIIVHKEYLSCGRMIGGL